MPLSPRLRRALLAGAAAAIAVSLPTYLLAPSSADRPNPSADRPNPSADRPNLGEPHDPSRSDAASSPGAVAVCPAAPIPTGAGGAPGGVDRLLTRFAVIGDYGADGAGEASVAALVKSWAPDFIITTGDNNYPAGGADTIDINIGKHYHQYIGGYHGTYGCRPAENQFFPSIGNHDTYTASGQPYRDYFQLPGNERYYDFVKGPVHLFALDSDPSEPDGRTATSTQAAWLRAKLAASTTRWQVVYMHHPPYSSGPHGSTAEMQWPYAAWGADLVLAGHDHTYERVQADGIPHVVNGLGGAQLYRLQTPLPGTVVSYARGFGAMLIDADANRLHARFYGTAGNLVDDFQLGGS